MNVIDFQQSIACIIATAYSASRGIIIENNDMSARQQCTDPHTKNSTHERVNATMDKRKAALKRLYFIFYEHQMSATQQSIIGENELL